MVHFFRMHTNRSRGLAAENDNSEPQAPTREEIAALAYSYWEARGRQGGSALDDWLKAERTLREQHSRFPSR